MPGPMPMPARPWRLLLIDDDPWFRNLLTEYLGHDGYLVRPAGTAEEGLRAIETERPDLVLLDLHLPDRSGFEVFRQLRQQSSALDVFLITGDATFVGSIRKVLPGAVEYLFKPIDLDELSRLLGHYFANRVRPMEGGAPSS